MIGPVLLLVPVVLLDTNINGRRTTFLSAEIKETLSAKRDATKTRHSTRFVLCGSKDSASVLEQSVIVLWFHTAFKYPCYTASATRATREQRKEQDDLSPNDIPTKQFLPSSAKIKKPFMGSAIGRLEGLVAPPSANKSLRALVGFFVRHTRGECFKRFSVQQCPVDSQSRSLFWFRLASLLSGLALHHLRPVDLTVRMAAALYMSSGSTSQLP